MATLSFRSISFLSFSLSLSLYAVSMPHPSELYDYCLNEGYADKNLIAKWKKVCSIAIALPEPTTDARHSVCVLICCCLCSQAGYENLCCLRCIQPRDTNFGTNCVCRVPKSKLESVSLYTTDTLQKCCVYDDVYISCYGFVPPPRARSWSVCTVAVGGAQDKKYSPAFDH